MHFEDVFQTIQTAERKYPKKDLRNIIASILNEYDVTQCMLEIAGKSLKFLNLIKQN